MQFFFCGTHYIITYKKYDHKNLFIADFNQSVSRNPRHYIIHVWLWLYLDNHKTSVHLIWWLMGDMMINQWLLRNIKGFFLHKAISNQPMVEWFAPWSLVVDPRTSSKTMVYLSNLGFPHEYQTSQTYRNNVLLTWLTYIYIYIHINIWLRLWKSYWS